LLCEIRSVLLSYSFVNISLRQGKYTASILTWRLVSWKYCMLAIRMFTCLSTWIQLVFWKLWYFGLGLGIGRFRGRAGRLEQFYLSSTFWDT